MIDRLIDISNTALLGLFGLWALYFLKVHSNEEPRQLRLWTGILMLVLAAQTLLWIVCSFVVPDYVEDTGASVTVGLLAAPFTVFVMMELTRLCHVTSRRVLKHVLVPLVLALVYIALLLWNVLSADSSQGQWRNITLLIYCIWMGCYIVYYICRFTVATRHYEQVVGDIYADVEGRTINWLKRIFGILLAVVAMFVVLIVLVDARWTLIAYNVADGIFWLALCRNIGLMRDNEAIETMEELQVITEPEPVPSTVEVQQTPKEEPKEMVLDWKSRIIGQQLYLQPNLTRVTGARALGTNYHTLTCHIKNETGMTFSQFFTSIRLEHAAELLTSTTMTVDDILFACGFRSSSTFYRQFTERYHCSPVEYRQRSLKSTTNKIPQL